MAIAAGSHPTTKYLSSIDIDPEIVAIVAAAPVLELVVNRFTEGLMFIVRECADPAHEVRTLIRLFALQPPNGLATACLAVREMVDDLLRRIEARKLPPEPDPFRVERANGEVLSRHPSIEHAIRANRIRTGREGLRSRVIRTRDGAAMTTLRVPAPIGIAPVDREHALRGGAATAALARSGKTRPPGAV